MAEYDDNDEQSFFQRYKFVLGGGALVLGVIGYVVFSSGGKSEPKKVERPIVVPISLPPPPPPPKPTPPPQPTPPPREDKPEPKMEKQETVETVEKPVEKPAEAPKDEPAPIGTSNVGDGPGDSFGLVAGKGGSGIGGSGSGSGSNTIGGSRGGKYGWYASQVQTKLVEAFKSNPKTRTAALQTEIRIWLDASGRIMRAKLSDSSGDAALDSAIQNEVLIGFKFPDAPPEGMPMPIVMKFSARRP